mgnify:CR=1 FL=1
MLLACYLVIPFLSSLKIMTQETKDNRVDMTRRRLTQGGVASPIILASILSKDALATNVAYRCTVSGKLSNNLSAKGPNQGKSDADCKLGKSQATFAAECNANTLTVRNYTLAASAMGLGLANKYFFNSTTNLITDSSLDAQAKVKRMLTKAGTAANLDYAKKAFVIYLNAYYLNNGGGGYTSYPLSKDEAATVFNAIANNSANCTIRSFTFTNAGLREYIDRLYY